MIVNSVRDTAKTIIDEAENIYTEPNLPARNNVTYFSRAKRSTVSAEPTVTLRDLFDEYILCPWQFVYSEIVDEFPSDALINITTPTEYFDFPRLYDVILSRDFDETDGRSFFTGPSDAYNKFFSYFKTLGKKIPKFFEMASMNTRKLDYHLRQYIRANVPFKNWFSPSSPITKATN